MRSIIRLTESDLTRIVKRIIKEGETEFDGITNAFQVFCNSLNSKIPQPSFTPNATSTTQPKLSVKKVVNRQVANGRPQGDGYMWQFYLGGKVVGDAIEHRSIFDESYNMRPNFPNLIKSVLGQIFNSFDLAYKKNVKVISGSLLNAYNASLPICVRSITAAVGQSKNTLGQRP